MPRIQLVVRKKSNSNADKGFALVSARKGGDIPEGPLKMVIQRPGHEDSFLGQKGWQSAEHTLKISETSVNGATTEFELGPDVVQFMGSGNYVVKLSSSNQDQTSNQCQDSILEGVMLWKGIPKFRPKTGGAGAFDSMVKDRTINNSTEKNKTETDISEPSGTNENKQNQKPPILPLDPAVSSSGSLDNPANVRSSQKSGYTKVFAFVLMLLIVVSGGVGAWYYWNENFNAPELSAVTTAITDANSQPIDIEPEGVAITPLSVNDQLTIFLNSNPSPEAMRGKGLRYIQEGEMGAAMSLLRRAGELGVGEAYIDLAKFYDPTVPLQNVVDAKDGRKAYSYYLKAKSLNASTAVENIARLKGWAEEKSLLVGERDAQRLLQIMSLNN